MRRHAGVALILAVLLAGCGSDEDQGGDELSAEAQWADGVCSARSELNTSLRALNDSIQFDSGSDADSLEQAQTEVSERLDAVRQSTADLRDAIRDAPAGLDGALADAQQQLSTSSDDVRTSVDGLAQAASDMADAQTVRQFTSASAAALTALTAAGNAVSGLADDVRGYARSADDAVQQAFDEAPSCQ
jgi:hypothetical protein